MELLAEGHIVVIGHCNKKHHLTPSKKCIQRIWIIQPPKEIILLSCRRSMVSLGVVTEETQKSTTEVS
jgi:hypothetical protein